ncbi:MAG: 16S rRNA (guanine(527)-N(7))-methyltransferase RsmG [Flavobacteriales bacterium]|nr:16S rRNA (guanine(527)-N(7))-methyltransferase RsmG [Flavobacteriales bacterium]
MSISVIQKYFPKLDDEKLSKFIELAALYEDWNSKINVISRKDMDHFYERHVLHSLSIVKFTGFKDGSKVMDLGTGGGFPAIPLAIYYPEVHFTAADSIAKKIKVVEEISKALGLQNLTAVNGRAESVKAKFDFVLTRAVADLPQLVQWSRQLMSAKNNNAIPNGLICLKGGDLSEELKPFKKQAQVYELKSWFDEEFFETKKIVYLDL